MNKKEKSYKLNIYVLIFTLSNRRKSLPFEVFLNEVWKYEKGLRNKKNEGIKHKQFHPHESRYSEWEKSSAKKHPRS